MKILQRFFNRNPTGGTTIEMLAQDGNYFIAWDGKLYESDIIRSCIRPFQKSMGKLVPKHLVATKDGVKVNPEPYIKVLLKEPNPFMTGQMLQEKLAIQLELNNNAFAYVGRDTNGYANQIYPINCVMAQTVYLDNGEIDIRFSLKNGKTVQFPYRDIIHLRNDFNNDDIFGESNAKALKNLMTIVVTTDQGVVNAIKNSAVIRWLLKFHNQLRPEDLEKETKKFAKSFLSTENNGTGVAGVDSKGDAIQIKPNDYVPNSSQMDRTVTRLYNFFGTNEHIVQGKYTEDQWNAYYEIKIEPAAIQLANQLALKLFSRRERAFGNDIVFESSNLQYASMGNKLNLLYMVDRGAMTPNEWRTIMNLGPIEGGDKVIRRLDTAIVKGGES